jgi:hypothetical protein
MKKIYFLLFFSHLTLCCLAESLPMSSSEPTLVIQNKILANVHGKTLSVMDVVKKMDVFISENYPDLANSPQGKFQFYSTQWKNILNELIDAELMIADAERLELKVTDAEVREELHSRFGPNIMKNLNKFNMSYEEARKMIWTDLVVQRMTWYRIHSKAVQSINPQDIRASYKEYSEKNPPSDEWTYEVLSIRAKDPVVASEISLKAKELVQQTQEGLKAVANVIQEKFAKNKSQEPLYVIQVSDPITVTDKEVSETYKRILKNLSIGDYSDPLLQQSRNKEENVQKMFHLINHTHKETPSFSSMADSIKQGLLQRTAAKQRLAYFKKIRKRYGFDENELKRLEGLQPFSLQ